MKKEQNQTEQKKDCLRRRAEGSLAGKSKNLDELSKTNIRGLIHELQVYRLELEMQNEELRRAQLELEESRNKYADLYDFAPVGYFTLHEKGFILEVNITGAALLGVERKSLIKKPFSRYIARENHDVYYSYRKRLLETTTRQTCKFRMLRKNGTPFYAQLESIAVFDSDGNFSHFRVVMLDVTQRNQAEEALRRAYDELEIRIQERTRELTKANEKLQAEIIECKRVEEALRESEEQYRNLFENIPTGIYRTTPDGRIVMANSALIRMLGYSSFDELASRNLEREGFKATYPRSQFKEILEREGEVRGLESAWIRRDGTVIFVRENTRAIRGEDGTVLYYEGTVENITERKRAEEALRESEEKYRTLVEHTYDLICETSIDGRFLYLSPNFKDMLGYEPSELVGRDIFEHIHPDDRPAVIAEFQRAAKTFSSGHIVYRYRHKNGEWFWFESTGKPYQTVSDEIRGVIASRDITERKRAEEQMKTSLKEKEVLLKEIYHRVKNNLQLISSLLNLESQHIKDKQALEMFKETQNRIKLMALIHEQLYQSKNLAMIDFVQYIRNLVDNLLYLYKIHPDVIQLKINVDDVSLSIDTAIPCGLIINELVSNSLKHAFPSSKKGEIRISLRSDNSMGDPSGRPYLTLIIGDNGIGFPNDLDFRNTESLGLQLVTDLVEQLEGTIELNRNGGTEFKIVFSP